MTSEERKAFWLGYSGIVPFFALIAGAAIFEGDLARKFARGLLFYEAVILSFLGGVIWGRGIAGMRDGAMLPVLIVSLIPSSLAWGGLWIGGAQGMVFCGVGLVLVLLYDLNTKALPDWFSTLRRHLTAWAAVSVLLLAGLILNGQIDGG